MTHDKHLIVHHFGPDPGYIGGMGSVIRVIHEHRVGADEVVIRPTWIPGSNLKNFSLTLRAAFQILQMPKSAIAHLHLSERGSFIREGILVGLAHGRRLKTVVSIHGADFVQFAERHQRFVSTVLSCADVITCLDPEALKLIQQVAPGSQAMVLPNPVPMDDNSPAADQTDELVVFAGEIGRRKGADVLHRAWQLVAESRPHARCVMVGPLDDFEVPQEERLEVCKPLKAIQMKDLLRTARVVALPSRAEGMPMILTEAMSGGRPFVSTPVGGIPDLARAGGGFLVKVGDEVELADCLSRLLVDPELAASMGERGRRFCRETRSVEVIDRRLREIYSNTDV
jgi:glycosyltransferase involved in cell wall biosynthesis